MNSLQLEEFEIKGFFYNVDQNVFRKYLDIKRISTKTKSPDIQIIMMNPGSSLPIIKDEFNQETPAKADKSQIQIIKVMNNCDFNYARILNLSDLVEPKSLLFHERIKNIEKGGFSHSIFDPTRSQELRSLFIKHIPTIYAWGVHKHIEPLAKNALRLTKSTKFYGIKKDKCSFGYYHPLPPIYSKQLQWVESISVILNATK